MSSRSTALEHPIDSAISTLAWLRQEEGALRRLIDLVTQHPDLFGAGASPIELAADALARHVDERGPVEPGLSFLHGAR